MDQMPKIVNDFLKKDFIPFFKENGFKKYLLNFVKKDEYGIRVVSFCIEGRCFSMRLGIHYPFLKVFLSESWLSRFVANPKKYYECCMYIDIERLKKPHIPLYSWVPNICMAPGEKYPIECRPECEAFNFFIEYGYPWLEKFKDCKAFLQHDFIDLRYAPVIQQPLDVLISLYLDDKIGAANIIKNRIEEYEKQITGEYEINDNQFRRSQKSLLKLAQKNGLTI